MARPAQEHRAPSGGTRPLLAPGAGLADDVIELIMADHRRIRRLRGALDDAVRSSGDSGPDWILTHIWQRLASLLEAHAQAEEEICYLPMFGSGPQAAERRREAIADHEDIREALSEASLQGVGSPPWWRAVRAALAASAEHLEREERGVLADCLSGLTLSRRRELGRQWSAFLAAWTRDAAPEAQPDPAVGRASSLSLPGRHWRAARE